MSDGTADVTAAPTDVERSGDRARAALIARLGIDDGIPLERVDTAGERRRVLYYRSADRLSLDAVNTSLADIGDASTVDALVRVTAIPYDDDGEVDVRALLELPVPDPALIAAAEQAVRDRVGCEQVVGVLVDAAPPPRRLHEYQLQESGR